MLKRKPIDTYIRRATAGLPRLERVDTAAEIRVHLLQKTRELMSQGFPREEAEHLAVQEMGPVAATNRALLGHFFTHRIGWMVLALMVVAGLGWLGFNAYQKYMASISRIDVKKSDLEGLGYQVFTLRAGANVRNLYWAITFNGEYIRGGRSPYDVTWYKDGKPVPKPAQAFTYDLAFKTLFAEESETCRDGGVRINDQDFCPAGLGKKFRDMGMGFGGTRIGQVHLFDTWIPVTDSYTRAEYQSPIGTRTAAVLWVNWDTNDTIQPVPEKLFPSSGKYPRAIQDRPNYLPGFR
jgi:hypothetical protein